MRFLRWLTISIVLSLIAGGIWACVYAYDKGLTKKWREIIREEFQKRGIEAEIGKLTLDPFQGLVARDVRFFEDTGRERLLAVINHIALDIDVSKLVRKEDFLSKIDIKNADLSLPVDPENRKSRRIEITDLSARVLLPGDKVELQRANGNFYGLHFNLSGILLKPETPPGTKKSPGKNKTRSAEKTSPKRVRLPVDLPRERRDAIMRIVDGIQAFTLTPEAPPVLDISISGDLGDLKNAVITTHLHGSKAAYNGYEVGDIDISAEYTTGNIKIKRLHFTDEKGALEGFASFAAGDRKIPFTVESTLNLQELAAAAAPGKQLSEVLFYEPPLLKMEGDILLDRAADSPGYPLDLTGEFSGGTTLSRGVILEGFSFDFRYRPEEFYLRNGLIDHTSGNASFQLMTNKHNGVRWKARIGFDPSLFAPFTKSEATRKFLNRIAFDDDSSIRIDVESEGPSPHPKTWKTTAQIEVWDFTFNGTHIDHFKTGFESHKRLQTYRNYRAVRKEGTVEGNLATYNLDNRITVIQKTRCTANHVAMVNCFSTKVADILRRYTFDGSPDITFSGTVDPANKKTDLDIDFIAGGTFYYTVTGTPLPFRNVRGRLKYQNRDIGLSLLGSLTPGANLGLLSFDSGADVKVTGWHQPDRTPASDFQISLGCQGVTQARFSGKNLPLTSLAGSLHSTGSSVDGVFSAGLMGGDLDLEVAISNTKATPSPYTLAVNIDDLRFKELAELYSDNYETAGNLSGSVTLQGRSNDLYSITGQGDATITDGNLYSIPIFGPLSKLVSIAIPKTKAGYSVAKRASCSFQIGGGKILTDDFEALTSTFKLTTSGTIDYRTDALDLRARMNFRGAPGFVLYPVSKLLEYRGRGTISQPVWTSATLGGLTRDEPAKKETAPRIPR